MMSVFWMAVIGAVILVEKTWRFGVEASYGATAALAACAVAWAL
jgi:predicted metal-binding membrane protein